MTDNVFEYGAQELAEMDPGERLLAQVKTGPWLDAQEFPRTAMGSTRDSSPKGSDCSSAPRSSASHGSCSASCSQCPPVAAHWAESRSNSARCCTWRSRTVTGACRPVCGPSMANSPPRPGSTSSPSLEPSAVHDLVGAWLDQHPERRGRTGHPRQGDAARTPRRGRLCTRLLESGAASNSSRTHRPARLC